MEHVGTNLRLDAAADTQNPPAPQIPGNSIEDGGTPESKPSPAVVEEPCDLEESKETVPLLQQVAAKHSLHGLEMFWFALLPNDNNAVTDNPHLHCMCSFATSAKLEVKGLG